MLKKNILICAYVCSPYRGSDAGIGWNNALYLSKYYNIWVIIREETFKTEIENYIRENGKNNSMNFIFLPHTNFEIAIMKYSILFYLGYNLWHKRVFSIARELNNVHSFAFTHMHTYVGFREPGYLWKLSIPFFWGPIGGVQNYPFPYLLNSGLPEAMSEIFRSFVNNIQLRLSQRVKKAAKKSACIFAANSITAHKFNKIYHVKTEILSDVGVTTVNATPKIHTSVNTIKLLWCGVFENRKALPLLLFALSRLPDTIPFEVHILGKGKLEQKWKLLSDKLCLNVNVKWLGWLPHCEALTEFTWCDVFVFTSLRDTSGNVLLEALSQSIPVITLDHQGAADIITDKCGIKIPVSNFKQTVIQLAESIKQLFSDINKLNLLSDGALKRANDFLWETKIEKMHELFELHS